MTRHYAPLKQKVLRSSGHSDSKQVRNSLVGSCCLKDIHCESPKRRMPAVLVHPFVILFDSCEENGVGARFAIGTLLHSGGFISYSGCLLHQELAYPSIFLTPFSLLHFTDRHRRSCILGGLLEKLSTEARVNQGFYAHSRESIFTSASCSGPF